MVNIVESIGGLGNQMFIYAFYYVLKRDNPFRIILYDKELSTYHHNGFELDLIFKHISAKEIKYSKYYRKLHSIYITKYMFRTVNRINITSNKALFKVYKDFWQSESYFSGYKNEIKQIFQFDLDHISFQTKQTASQIINVEAIGIHVRRGDYILNNELNNSCSLEYYQLAIHLIKSHIKNPFFYVFTDDYRWVKSTFDFFDYKVIDFNTEKNSWQDMYLMSLCKHNIIANSTFSWWAAWLNQNPDKIVIAPKKWFETLNYDNITPEKWIRI